MTISILLTLEAGSRIEGKAGDGGAGGSYLNGWNGPAGQNGGDALLVEHPISVDNNGQIWAGGGGGGGGGGMSNGSIFWGGGGGGGGGGEDPSAGGAAGAEFNVYAPGLESQSGTPGTTETHGVGGLGGRYSGGGPVFQNGGNGGAGGDPGEDGSAGQAAQNGTADGTVLGAGGAAGTKGRAIVNDADVTWIATGDRRGTIA